MSIALVQQSAAATSFSASYTSSPTLPGNSTANNLIVIPVSHSQFDGPGDCTFSATGYTAVQTINQVSGVISTAFLYKVTAGGSETPAVTVSTSGSAANSFGQSALAEFSGCGASPYVSADSNTAGGNSTAPSVSTGNPLSESNALIIVSFQAGTALNSWPPSSWTNMFNNLSNGWGMAYLVVSSNAQITAAATLASAGPWAGSIVVFKAASAGGGKLLLLGSNSGGF